MSYFKVGFATSGAGGNPTGIGDYVRQLDAAGIPATIACVDGTVGISDALTEINNNGSTVKHNLLYRVVRGGREEYAVPRLGPNQDYQGTPAEAAQVYYDLVFPFVRAQTMVEQNKDKVWISIGNELNKDDDNIVNWIGYWATETAKIANAAGYKVMAFGWASGTPKPHHWRLPGMETYLRYCAAHPDQAGVALHEYTYDVNYGAVDGEKIGRFVQLFKACDDLGIHRPYVFIKENGWTNRQIPNNVDIALQHVRSWVDTYAKYPTILGSALWYLGGGNEFGDIANQTQRLIQPITGMATTYTPPAALPTPVLGTTTSPNTQANQSLRQLLQNQVLTEAFNPDAALYKAMKRYGDRPIMKEKWPNHEGKKYAVQAGVSDSGEISIYYARVHQWDQVKRIPFHQIQTPTAPPPPPAANTFATVWPCNSRYVTQPFGVVAPWYTNAGLPGHEGVDYGAVKGSPFYAVANGRVVYAGKKMMSRPNTDSAYGYYIVIDHENGFHTLYGHAHPNLPVRINDRVQTGDIIGYSGNTGNSTGYHLHFTILSDTDPQNGYPATKFGWFIDPTPYLPNSLPIPQTPPVTGPQSATIDLARFMIGEPHIQFMVQHPEGPSQRIRTEPLANGHWRYVKGHEWELWQLDNDQIKLIADTSPHDADDGTDRYYVVTTNGNPGGVWAKRHMRVNQQHTDGGHTVQFYNKQNGQNHFQNSGASQNNTIVLEKHTNYTFNSFNQNLTFDEVLVVQGNTEVHYFAIKDGDSYGRVAWQAPFGRSEITEIITNQAPILAEIVPFLTPYLP